MKNEVSSLADVPMTNEQSSNISLRPGEQNAPIEIKQKNEQSQEAASVVAQTGDVKKKESEEELEALARRKKQVQVAAVKLFKQIKAGCNKDVCFNEYCLKNPFSK